MNKQEIKPEDVLHAAKLYTTVVGVVGKPVMCRAAGDVFACIVCSCVIEEHVITLGLSLLRFQKSKVVALVFDSKSIAWSLHLEKRNPQKIDFIEFYHS